MNALLKNYIDAKGEHRAKMTAPNGKIIFATEEGFKTLYGLKKHLRTVAKNFFRLTDEEHNPVGLNLKPSRNA